MENMHDAHTSFLGSRIWAIAEGYIPGQSVNPADPALVSHEAACLLNLGDTDAKIEITVYFEILLDRTA